MKNYYQIRTFFYSSNMRKINSILPQNVCGDQMPGEMTRLMENSRNRNLKQSRI